MIPGRDSTTWLLAPILAGATFLSAWGLSWGLPHDRLPYGTLHPDEFVLLGGLQRAWSGEPIVRHYPQYGSGYYYPYAAWEALLRGAGVLDKGPLEMLDVTPWMPFRNPPVPPTTAAGPDAAAAARFYLAARWMSVGMSVATVALAYAIGRALAGPRAGWMAALGFACMPLRAVQSHYCTSDTMVTLCVTLALALAARAMLSGRGFLLAGIAAGFAGGVKTYGLGAMAPALAACVLAEGIRRAPRRVAHVGAGAALGYLAGNPVFVVAPVEAVRELYFYLHGLGGASHHVEHATLGWGFYPGTALFQGAGLPLQILFLAGVAFAAVRRTRGDLLLLALVVPYFVLMSRGYTKLARYLLPVAPALSVLAASLVAAALERFSSLWTRRAVGGAAVAAAAYAGCYAWALVRIFGEEDPRIAATRWIERSIPDGSGILVWKQPMYHFQVPPLLFESLQGRPWGTTRWNLRCHISSLTAVGDPPVEEPYLVCTDYEIRGVEGAGDAFPDGRRFLERLRSGREFRLEREFANRPRFLGLPFPTARIEHAQRFHFPAVYVYRNLGVPPPR